MKPVKAKINKMVDSCAFRSMYSVKNTSRINHKKRDLGWCTWWNDPMKYRILNYCYEKIRSYQKDGSGRTAGF